MPELKDIQHELYRQWETSMTQWWDRLLDDPTFVKGMGDQLASGSRARKGWEDQVDRTMENLHLPSRKDVVRVARIASLLEDKLLAVEDQVLDQGDVLRRVEKESLQARIDAAEALVTVQDRLEAVEAKLDKLLEHVAALAALQEGTPAKKPARSRSRGRKATSTPSEEG